MTQRTTQNTYLVKGVFLGGADILWTEEDPFADDDGKPVRHKTLSLAQFEKSLSAEMVIPQHLLKVTYAFDKSAGHNLLVPAGATTRKR